MTREIKDLIDGMQSECESYKHKYLQLKSLSEATEEKRLAEPKGPFYTRHNQYAWVESEDDNYAYGFIQGDSGKLHRFSWYVCKSSSDMPYIAAADYPCGNDLSLAPAADGHYWASERNTNINGKKRQA